MAPEKTTQLVAAGDWFALGRIPEEVRAQPETAAVFEVLHAADIAFVNQEAPLTRRGLRAEKQNTLRADPAQVEDLLLAGVDVASLANNHMLDYGVDGLADTLALLAECGIHTVGAGPTLDAARAPVVGSRTGAVPLRLLWSAKKQSGVAGGGGFIIRTY